MDFLLKFFQITRSPGAGAELWLDTTSLVSTLAIIVALGLLAVFLPMRTLRGLSRGRQSVMVGLRLVLVALLGLLLLKPSVVLLSPVTNKEKLAVLVDASRSMSIAPEPGKPTRWQAAVETLKAGPLGGLARRYDLDLFTFGSRLTSISGREALGAVKPEDEETDLGEALQSLTREGQDLSLGGVVVLADGIDRGILRKRWKEAGDQGLKTALEPFNLPIHTYDLGQDEHFVDLAIEDLKYNEFAFLRQPFKVQAVIRSRNLAGTQTQVRLTSGGRLLGVRKVTLPAEGKDLSVEFEINPDKVGKFTYTIDSPVLPKEAVAENNRRSFTLKVVRDKIRVLQVAGAPSWDVKYLRRLLKSDPNIDLVSFFILRGPSDQSMFPRDDYSLIEFPYQDLFDKNKDLMSFDVVVFQNFAYGPYLREQSNRLLASLADFVREGGGLAMLGGEMGFAAGDYGGTPLEDVLPVRMDRSPSVVSGPVKFSITPQGLRHPVTVLHFDPDVNRAAWDRLPAMDGYNPTSAQPDSVVLATVGAGAGGSSDVPLLAVRKVGRGRTMALMSDTSWYWSFKAVGENLGNLSYLRFWKNSLRWLVGDPDEGQIQIDTERENYRMGEEAIIQVKVAGADYGPVKDAPVQLEIRQEELNEPPIKLSGKTGPDGEFDQRFKATKAGPYRVKAIVSGARAKGEAETVFTISEEGPEMKELAGDREFLAALSRVTGGEVLDPRAVGELKLKPHSEKALSQRTVVPLWDRMPPYLLLLALLCGEWGLRRRWGLR